MTHFLFYDLETTGLNPVFDQILQFAAILTDDSLRELTSWDLVVRLRPDVIPSAGALVKTRTPVAMLNAGISEYDAVCQIHRLVNQPDTINLGFNSLRFDDKFLRFAFYRNLWPAYTHQWNQGCRRGDLLPIVVLYRLFETDALVWPLVNGKSTLKLEDLSRANGFGTGHAHQAMADVRATVDMARCLANHPNLWQRAWGHFDKGQDRRRIHDLLPLLHDGPTTYRKGLIADAQYGPDQNYQVPAVYLGDSIHYQNQTLWLRLDHENLPGLVAAGTPDKLIIRKKLAETGFILETQGNSLGPERLATAKANCEWLNSAQQAFISAAHSACAYQYPAVLDMDTDAALYQRGFPTLDEQRRYDRFHAADLDLKRMLADNFSNPVDRALASRLLGRNFGPAGASDEFATYLARITAGDDAPSDFKGGKKRLRKDALAEIEELQQVGTLDALQLTILGDFKAYLTA